MSRVALKNIKSLTFYKDSLTAARRTEPVPQLACLGKACSLYTPDVVRCVNVGGEGTEVDWKCEADLPEALRFGRVEVSCEGWNGPGDPYVLKGSCALEYRLVEIPGALRKGEDHRIPGGWSNWLGSQDIGGIAFFILWTGILLFILYQFLKSCLEPRPGHTPGRPNTGGPRGGGWFSGQGHRPDDFSNDDTPPPYTKYPNTSATRAADPGWRPGFWSGAALGGLGAYLFNNNRREERPPTRTSYDWERPARARPSPFVSGYSSTSRQRSYLSDDRGEGSSNLGSMHRSTGLGGSNVR